MTATASSGPVTTQVTVGTGGVKTAGHLGQRDHEDGEEDVARQQTGQGDGQDQPAVAVALRGPDGGPVRAGAGARGRRRTPRPRRRP